MHFTKLGNSVSARIEEFIWGYLWFSVSFSSPAIQTSRKFPVSYKSWRGASSWAGVSKWHGTLTDPNIHLKPVVLFSQHPEPYPSKATNDSKFWAFPGFLAGIISLIIGSLHCKHLGFSSLSYTETNITYICGSQIQMSHCLASLPFFSL